MSLFCRKPPALARLLGVELAHTDVNHGDIVPRAVWAGNPTIQQWGLCWRVLPSQRIEIACSYLYKGNMIPGYGNVLEILENVEHVDILISLPALRDPSAPTDYIAVSMPWAACTEAVCGEPAVKQGMTFNGAAPATIEEFMDAWSAIDYARLAINNAIDAAAAVAPSSSKRKPTPSKKKRPTAEMVDLGDDGDENVQGSQDPSKPKRRAKSTKDAIEYSLDEALTKGNQMTSKMKDVKIDAIYKALETGLGHLFPYKKRRLPGVISSEKLHIAPDELKYRRIAKDRLGQVF